MSAVIRRSDRYAETQAVQDLEQRGHADLVQLGEDSSGQGTAARPRSAWQASTLVILVLLIHAWRYTGDATDTLFRKSIKITPARLASSHSCRRDVVLRILWHQDMEFAALQQPTRILTHAPGMSDHCRE